MPFTIHTADFLADQPSIKLIRSQVFIEEQQVPKELEFDEHDKHCLHLLCLANAAPVATCRFDLKENGRIGRVAVLKNFRRQGIAKAMMLKLHEIAREHHLDRTWCHAQTSAILFYESLGYTRKGAPFMEAGIEHQQMELKL